MGIGKLVDFIAVNTPILSFRESGLAKQMVGRQGNNFGANSCSVTLLLLLKLNHGLHESISGNGNVPACRKLEVSPTSVIRALCGDSNA